MVSMPITVAVEWIVMNVLAAKTKKYHSRRSIVAAMGNSESDTSAFPSSTRRKSVFDALGFFRASTVAVDTSEDEMRNFAQKLKTYRSNLCDKDKKEFDGTFSFVFCFYRYSILS